jgi:hypothetical protein
LDGAWRFALDGKDAGVAESWFNRRLPDRIKLPGVLQSQGYGDEISTATPWGLSLYDRNWFLRGDYRAHTNAGSVRVPFVCPPPRHYLGAAWCQRDIEIPKEWAARRAVLFLERPHWESRVWLDDRLVGTNNSLCVPHEHDLGVVQPGKHRLTVRVDNRMLMNYRPDAHAVSDSLGSTWNGITGAIELRSTPLVWIDDVRVFPRAETKFAVVRGTLGNLTGLKVTNSVGLCLLDRFDARPRFPTTNVSVVCPPGGASVEAEVTCGNAVVTWDEFTPHLFELTVTVGGLLEQERRTVLFGFREFKAVGQDFVINGRPTHLRGTHHGGDFPLTGYPKDFPNDVSFIVGKSDWRRDWNYVQPARIEGRDVPVVGEDDDEASGPNGRALPDLGRASVRSTAWSIQFEIPEKPRGQATLRLTFCGTHSGCNVEVLLNGKSVGETGELPSTSAMQRDGIRAYWIEKPVSFDGALLKRGQNVIQLKSQANSWSQGVMYDCVRLELDEATAQTKP